MRGKSEVILKITPFLVLLIYGLISLCYGNSFVDMTVSGTIGIGIALFWLFVEHVAWKWKIARGFLKAHPDISGRWTGTIHRDGDKSAHEATFDIHQTWSTLSVKTSTKRANSLSRTAHIISNSDEGAFKKLVFTWDGEANSSSFDGRGSLWGTTVLDLSADELKLDGHYFTNMHPNQTRGEVSLNKAG